VLHTLAEVIGRALRRSVSKRQGAADLGRRALRHTEGGYSYQRQLRVAHAGKTGVPPGGGAVAAVAEQLVGAGGEAGEKVEARNGRAKRPSAVASTP
jgi:hypothetical protein